MARALDDRRGEGGAIEESRHRGEVKDEEKRKEEIGQEDQGLVRQITARVTLWRRYVLYNVVGSVRGR